MMKSFIPLLPGWNDRPLVKLAKVTELLVVATVSVSTILMIYWRGFDPVVPDMKVEFGQIVNYSEPNNPILERPGVFKINRVINSSESKDAVVTSFFRPSPRPVPEFGEPDAVVRDGTRLEIATSNVTLGKGREMRERLYEVPAILPPGDYDFLSVWRFCNFGGRCENFTMPPIPVKIGSRNWPPKPESP